MITYVPSIYLQYGQSTHTNNWLNNIAPLLTIDEQQYYNDFFNIETGNRQGLDNWGRILNISGTIYMPDLSNVLGFDTGEVITNDVDYPQNFGQGNFWGGQVLPILLSDPEFRLLLKYKYGILTTNGTILDANILLNNFFNNYPGNPLRVRVTQTAVMEVTFEFNGFLTNTQFTIINNRNLLPLSGGSSYIILQGGVF
jgi:hypothetical protein